jgi:hypothetical protein
MRMAEMVHLRQGVPIHAPPAPEVRRVGRDEHPFALRSC